MNETEAKHLQSKRVVRLLRKRIELRRIYLNEIEDAALNHRQPKTVWIDLQLRRIDERKKQIENEK